MAYIENPRKDFNWTVFTPGLNPYIAQDVTMPAVDFDVIPHGDTNYDVKTAGRKKYEPIQIVKLMPGTESDLWIWPWIYQIQDEFLGGGSIPQLYKRTLEFQHFSTDNLTILDRWVAYGCWPSHINGTELKRMGTANTIETITLQLDRLRKLPL